MKTLQSINLGIIQDLIGLAKLDGSSTDYFRDSIYGDWIEPLEGMRGTMKRKWRQKNIDSAFSFYNPNTLSMKEKQ